MPDSIIPTTVSLLPPSCFDRANGLNGFPGTPTPNDGTITILSSNGTVVYRGIDSNFFEEYPDSPTFEMAEQATITHRCACDISTGEMLLGSISRGMLLLDSNTNVTRVLSITGQYKKPDHYDITIVTEGMTFNNPPDEFRIGSIELNPAAEKHPRYACLTYGDRYLVRNSNLAQTPDFQDAINARIDTIIPIADTPGELFVDRHAAAKELLLKNLRGESTFYLPGLRVSWTQYYWLPQSINPGGYIENPVDTSPTGDGIILPYYFWSTNGQPDGPSIFDNMFAYNPLIYNGGISWMRLQDEQELQRTWFRLTRTWIGAPLGHWDAEWYTSFVAGGGFLPYQTDFDQGALAL